jgi:anti-anti-sigma regulatory factor
MARRKSRKPRVLVLEGVCNIQQAAELKARLVDELGPGKDLVIDGSAVEEVDTAIVQLLIAATAAARSQGGTLRWQSPSAALRRCAETIGLAAQLDLDGHLQPAEPPK